LTTALVVVYTLAGGPLCYAVRHSSQGKARGGWKVALEDRKLVCRDCGEEFTFSAGEQAFYMERVSSTIHSAARCAGQTSVEREANRAL
jgi:hypothetical protein